MTKNDKGKKTEMMGKKSRVIAVILVMITLLVGMPISAHGASEVELKGYSISISDCINLRYHIEMSEDMYVGGGYIRFIINGEVREIQLSEGEIDTETGYYVYSCEVAAAEMAEQITAILYSENGSVIRSFGRYSVKEYAIEIIDGSEYGEAAIAAVKAMLNYGAYAQKYFGNTENGLANDGIEDNVSDLVSVEDGMFMLNWKFGGLKYVSTALELQSRTVMYHYFKFDETVDISKLIFKFNGKVVEPFIDEKNGEQRYCLKSEGIAPVQLWRGVGLSVQDTSSNTYSSLSYSAIHYLYEVITKVDDNDSLVDLAKAMYLYSQAVLAYDESIN